MIISVSDAQKLVGVEFPIDITETIDPEVYNGKELKFNGPAAITGKFASDGNAIPVEAEGEVQYLTECARCTKRFMETLTFPINEYFVRDISWDMDQDTYPYTSEKIDLKQPFLDNLFLNLPLISLCKPDCRGLCPYCGADLNETTCSCESDRKDSKFDLLKQLLNENKEV